MSFDVLWCLELSQNSFGQNLPQLNAHLIYKDVSGVQKKDQQGMLRTERIDTPDDTLDEDLVFVQSDQRS